MKENIKWLKAIYGMNAVEALLWMAYVKIHRLFSWRRGYRTGTTTVPLEGDKKE